MKRITKSRSENLLIAFFAVIAVLLLLLRLLVFVTSRGLMHGHRRF